MTALIRRELPWWDPSALARALAGRCGAEGLVLLQGDGGPQGQRAVLGVDPLQTVCCRGLPGAAAAADPFAALRAMVDSGLPWLGWLAYEAGAWVEPSAPWRDPQMATLWAVQHDPLIHFDLAARRCWLEGRDPLRLEAMAERIEALTSAVAVSGAVAMAAPALPIPSGGHPPLAVEGAGQAPPAGASGPLHGQSAAASPSEESKWAAVAQPPAPRHGVAPALQPPLARSGRGPAAASSAPEASRTPAISSRAAVTPAISGLDPLADPVAALVAAEDVAGGEVPSGSPPLTPQVPPQPQADAGPGPAGLALGVGAEPAEAARLRDAAGAAAQRPVPPSPLDGEWLSRRQPALVDDSPAATPAIPREAWRWHTTPERYAEQVAELLERIASGDLFQANLTACCETWLERPPDPLCLWERLSHACPAPFAGVAIASGQAAGEAVISASPERFLCLSPEGLVETRPIKGTRPRSVDAERDAAAAADLVCDPKDRAENVMIVDLLRNDLGRVCEPGSIQVPQLVGLESYPQVHHLTSVVTGTLAQGRDLVDLLRACWPGGSISGAPKVRACTRLHALEPVPRGPYCGSLFHLRADGGFDSSILIRSVMVQGRRLRVHAGGGIVADSDPAAEAEEMGWKIEPLLEALE